MKTKQVTNISEVDIQLTVKDNAVLTTSLQVAEVFGKQHFHVVRDIEKLKHSDEVCQSNFGLTYKITKMPNGGKRKDKCYSISKDGFVMLAMGFTGEKAMRFKIAYINAFNAMEKQLLDKQNTQMHRLAAQYEKQLSYIKQLEQNQRTEDTTDMMPEQLRQLVYETIKSMEGNINMLLMSISKNTGFSRNTRINNMQAVIENMKMAIRQLTLIIQSDLNKDNQLLSNLRSSIH